MENIDYKKMYEKAKSDIESLHHSFMDIRGRNEQLMDELKAKNEELEILKIKYKNIKELYDTAKRIVNANNDFVDIVNVVAEHCSGILKEE